MILKLLSIVLFWRRNNLPSILFKSLFWGVLAWFAVGIFTSFQTAVIGGAAASLLAACKYSMKYLSRRKRMLAKVDGDKEKYKALKNATNKGGLGGALLGEMLNSELEMDDDDEYIEEELTDEERAANKAATENACQELTSALMAGKHASEAQCKEATESIMEDYGDGEGRPEAIELLHSYLPDSVLSFDTEDYCNDDDHASLVEMFAESTNGKWKIEDAASSFDEESQKWLVTFTENGEKKTWRFTQHADHLNGKFVEQLRQYTQSRSGYIVEYRDGEDEYVEMTSLPADIHALLFAESTELAA